MNIAILGLSITSSWGNGHATTFRSLVKGLHRRGHKVIFLERDMPWYASNRDMPVSEFCKIILYNSTAELRKEHSDTVRNADAVMVGSYVPDGIEIGRWVTENAKGIKAFYDIDTPVTLSKLRIGSCQYISPLLIPHYDIYLSFTAGPCLGIFEREYGSPAARKFYCSVDPDLYYPSKSSKKWDMGYLGTYSDDRQPALNSLMLEAAMKWPEGKFVVAGPQYPAAISWPSNVERIEHMPPSRHVDFYNNQRYTLNITRQDMVKMGYSPSVRLFEAAACGAPLVSDWWEGLDTLFRPGEEIFISQSADDTLQVLTGVSESQRSRVGENSRKVVLEYHTGYQRAAEFEEYVSEAAVIRRTKSRVPAGQG
ncbi:MAG TPA: glycosyltransferase [Bacteroidales bacterium]|nr:glycosyltransferase [Bacteroidales bacterium]